MRKAIVLGIVIFGIVFASVKTHAEVQTVVICDAYGCRTVTIYTPAPQPFPPI